MTDMLTKDEWVRRASAPVTRTRLWIDGDFVDAASGKTFECVNPRDGAAFARVAEGDAADVDRAVASARRSFESGAWREAAPAHRKAVMLRWAQLIREHAHELALLETLNVGKPISDSVKVDVEYAATNVQWYAETIDKMYGEVAPVPRDSLAIVEREPLGVVGRSGRRSPRATPWCSSPPSSPRSRRCCSPSSPAARACPTVASTW